MDFISSADVVVNSGLVSRSDCCLPGKTRAISGRHASQSGSSMRTWRRSSLAPSICCVCVCVCDVNQRKNEKLGAT